MKPRLIFILFFFIQIVYAQDSLVIKYAGTITEDELYYHLNIISSDEYEGRNTGEKGQKLAAKYISEEFLNDKITGPVKNNKNLYYQEFDLVSKRWTSINILSSGSNFSYLDDFYVIDKLEAGDKSYELVFAGYGIDKRKYSDFKNIDIEGKFVAVLMGEPIGEDGNFIISGTTKPSMEIDYNYKIQIAKNKGASGIIFVEKNDETYNGNKIVYGEYFSRARFEFLVGINEGKFSSIYTSRTRGMEMLGVKPGKFENALNEISSKGKSTAGRFFSTIKIEAKQGINNLKTENVAGFIEGKKKKDEVVVITAHYDHIGIMGDQVFNGADDNGSGVVALLEIAEAFRKAKEEGNGPLRSILFLALTAEELGLFGSEYYINNPIFPLKNVVANLNIDMIGRTDSAHIDNPDYVYIIGSDFHSMELHNINEDAARLYTPSIKLDYKFNSINHPEQWYYRSDHYNFAKNDIPVIFYNTGGHSDYHRPSDTVEKINFNKLKKISRLIFATAWELANREERIIVDIKEE